MRGCICLHDAIVTNAANAVRGRYTDNKSVLGHFVAFQIETILTDC